jgi:hypothetical protein
MTVGYNKSIRIERGYTRHRGVRKPVRESVVGTTDQGLTITRDRDVARETVEPRDTDVEDGVSPTRGGKGNT